MTAHPSRISTPMPNIARTALGLLLLISPARADDSPLTAVAAAYRNLAHYRDEGRLVITTPAGAEHTTPAGITFSRPNLLRLDAGSVQLFSDGARLITANLATKTYLTAPAPGTIRPATITEGSAGAVLLGGPGGLPAAIVLNLLFADAAEARILTGATRAVAEPDRTEAGQVTRVLRLDHVSGPDLLLGIDPQTNLLRWVELAPEGEDPTRIRWSAGPVSTDPIPSETFKAQPPPGLHRVEPLKADPPRAPAPARG